MSRPLFDPVLKLLLSLLTHSRDFVKRFLLGAPPAMPPSSITNKDSNCEFQSGKQQLQTCIDYFCMVLLHFSLLLKPLFIPKLLLSPAAPVFQYLPCPRLCKQLPCSWAVWEGRKPSKWTIPASQTAPAQLRSWGIPQEAFRRVEKAETRSRPVLLSCA